MTTSEAPPPKLARPPHPARRTLLEILTVLCLTVFPSLIESGLYYFTDAANTTPAVGPLSLLLGEFLDVFRFTIPVLYIMWTTGKGFRHFGFTRLQPWDVLYAVAILIGAYMFHFLVWDFFASLVPELVQRLSHEHENRLLHTFAQSHTYNARILLIPACLLVGFSEELLFRAYLLTRLTDLTGSKYQALFLTTILFAFLHIYQGAIGIVSAAAIAAFYGAIFLLTRRFWPLAIAHALNDFIAFISL